MIGGGWPRLPAFDEMTCLAYLSVIHGSRGIYFYTYPAITSAPEGKEDFGRLLRRLNGMRSWLQVGNAEQYNTGMLICVNTIRTYTEAHIEVPSGGPTDWQDYYTVGAYPVVDGIILARFAPLEVKVLLESSKSQLATKSLTDLTDGGKLWVTLTGK